MRIPVGKIIPGLPHVIFLVLLSASSIRAASDTRTGAGSYDDGTNWTNPGNVTGAGDNSCATYNEKGQNQIVLYNYGFNIPSAAAIDSIYVYVDGYGQNGVPNKRDFEAQLTKTGGTTNVGIGDLEENVRMTLAISCAASNEYSIEDNGLWGTTWTYSEINASSFGIIVKDDDGGNNELGLDAVKITVVYTEAGGVSPRRKKVSRILEGR